MAENATKKNAGADSLSAPAFGVFGMFVVTLPPLI